jgi:hypothetical protein
MAFLGGTVSLRTFRARGRTPSSDAILLGLADRAFRDSGVGDGGGTEPVVGWVTRRDLFDIEFDEGTVLLDGHAVFGLRVDRRQVPGSLLDAHVARAGRAWLREHGKESLPRAVRHEIREEERRALLATIPSTPSVHPVIWDVRCGLVHLGALSSTKGEVFTRLFRDAFHIGLEPFGPDERPDEIAVVRDRVKSLAPLDLVSGGVRPAEEGVSGSFLGRDFLSWLLYRVETEGGELRLDGWGRIALVFEDRLAFEGEDHSCRLQVLQQGHPSVSAEAKTALLLGKKLVRARITLAADDEETWQLTLDADTFDLRSVKLPRTAETDPEARLLERLDAIDRVHGAVDALYRAFLKARTGGSFLDEEGPKLSAWVRERRSDGDDLFASP